MNRHILLGLSLAGGFVLGTCTGALAADPFTLRSSAFGDNGKMAANQARAKLSSFYQWMMKRGIVASNPVALTDEHKEVPRDRKLSMDELVAEDYLDHNPPPFPGLKSGREGLKQAFKIFWEATPGYHEIEDMIAEGDKVVTRMTSYGKHEKDLPGAPATGNEMKMTSITIHRIANGKLVEKWAEKDVMGFLIQIGVMRPMKK